MAKETGKTSGEAPFSQVLHDAQRAVQDFGRMFADLKPPVAADTEALMAAYRRNMDALSAASRVALDGAQAVARRHLEIMQQSMAELSETMRSLAAPGASPQAGIAGQGELLRQAYERAAANIRELGELIQRSNGEALDLLNKRFAEAAEEVKALSAKATSHKP
jgi:phasin family protein